MKALNVTHVKSVKIQMKGNLRMKEKIVNTPSKLNALLSKTNPNCVNLALKEQSRKRTELEKKI